MKISKFIAVNFWQQQRIEEDALLDGIHFFSIKIIQQEEDYKY